jgi:hypothetical protein
MKEQYFNHTIEAVKLAGAFDGRYYPLIDGMLDCEIAPSKYPAVTIRRIKHAYAMGFIFEARRSNGTGLI